MHRNTVVDGVLVNWKRPELTNNELNGRLCPYHAKQLMNEQVIFQAITRTDPEGPTGKNTHFHQHV